MSSRVKKGGKQTYFGYSTIVLITGKKTDQIDLLRGSRFSGTVPGRSSIPRPREHHVQTA